MLDERFMKRAVDLAQQSPEPVGCGVVIVNEGNIIAEAYNSQKADNIAVYHAEIKAIIEANRSLGIRKLKDATAYCSCEPCAMCLTALSYASVRRIVYHNTMHDLFPDDPQSQFNSYEYIKGLNFIPKLEHFIFK
jgi:tRNA(adenine34) deaminase